MSIRILNADCLTALPQLAAESVHAIVTDPPAGISFMGKDWDGDKGGRDHWIAWMQEVAAECLRVCKPGGHALVWALPRTSHWTATAWENAGWQVRDRCAHLFGSGFPKSLDVSKAIDRAAGAEREVVGRNPNHRSESGVDYVGVYAGGNTGAADITAPATPEAAPWSGWGTALKPACEDWWLLRKPLGKGLSVAANTLRHGCGGLNIDACRVPGTVPVMTHTEHKGGANGSAGPSTGATNSGEWREGRWPANVLHDGSPEVEEAFARFGERTSGALTAEQQERGGFSHPSAFHAGSARGGLNEYGSNTGSASRFFFCAKADASDRAGSRHPTVKPTSLMRWLVQLVTPPGGTVLDPFAGTGSTGLAADQLGMNAVLIERDPTYAADARRKIASDAPLFTEVA